MFLKLSTAIALAISVSGAAHASSIFGDTFELAFIDSGIKAGTVPGFPTISGVADPGTQFDIDQSVPGAQSDVNIDVNWVDEDSVDISFFGSLFDQHADNGYELSSLDFGRAITGVTFNRLASDIDDFIGDDSLGQPLESEFVEPIITFTDTSFEAVFGYWNQFLVADGPRLRYDVTLAPAPVPLPAGAILLLSGLGALALRRCRK